MFGEAVKEAEEYGIRMAVENHIDFTADEMLRLLTQVNSPWLGITLILEIFCDYWTTLSKEWSNSRPTFMPPTSRI
jgi:hypothetical protein